MRPRARAVARNSCRPIDMSVVSAARASGDELASFDVAWVRKKSQDGFLIFPSIGKSWYGDGGDGAGDAPASSVLAMYLSLIHI